MTPRDTYTHGHHESVLRSHQWRTAANSAAYLLPHLSPGMRVLDVGCGPGTVTLDLAELVTPGTTVGVDAVPEPLDAARVNAQRRGDERTEFRVGDVYDLEADDGEFDVVHAHQVLQHLTRPVAALREMRRVCRAGGLVAARDADYAAMVWYPADPRLDDWLTLYQAVARSNDAEPDAGRRLLSWVHAAGFEDVTCSASTWCYASADERAWWGGLWADRVTGSALADQARSRGLASSAELERIADGWRAWAAHPDGWFAIPHGEVLARC
ncbi:methyltransferase domain-containing protein [Lapillicoccus sp.]|uniref:methyltransferase domain-containing protein n=1 Tax=Lapillicoccus sp. TaxID=1909287 RepID=UPI0032674ADA